MKPTDLKVGDVVQIAPGTASAFAGCLMIVTEPKSFGAQGFIPIPTERGKAPGEAYYRARWDEIEFVGRVTWVSRGAGERLLEAVEETARPSADDVARHFAALRGDE